MKSRRANGRTPIVIVVLGAVACLVFALPLVALLVRVPWRSVGSILTSAAALEALWLSIVTSVVTTLLALGIGVPLAWLLARTHFFGKTFVRAVCTLSMVLPPVVAGVALLATYGRRGIIGSPLEAVFGLRLPFTMPAVVIAQLFVAMPFLVLTVESAFNSADQTVEEAARTLGASALYTFVHVNLPQARSSIIAGAVLTWARALGEFGATITFAGNFPGTTRTLPIATYLSLESDLGEALAMSMMLVVVSLTVLIAMRARFLPTLGESR